MTITIQNPIMTKQVDEKFIRINVIMIVVNKMYDMAVNRLNFN